MGRLASRPADTGMARMLRRIVAHTLRLPHLARGSLGWAQRSAPGVERWPVPSRSLGSCPPWTPGPQLEEEHMRTRSLGLTLFAGLSIFVAACSSGGVASPAALDRGVGRTVDGRFDRVGERIAAHRRPCRRRVGLGRRRPPDLKIGVVTDIGTLDDKNYNEYTYKGVQAGAAAIGAANPPAVVPKDASEYAPEIQAYVDQGFNMIVTVGFNLGRRHDGRRPRQPGDLVHRRRPVADLRRRDRRAGLRRFACKGNAADARSELHLDQLPGGPGRLPRRDHRRVRQQERRDRRHRRHHPVRAVRPVHPGLRARREVGQPGHQGRRPRS